MTDTSDSRPMPYEFSVVAANFVAQHLPFLSERWRYDVLVPKLARLLADTIDKHTSPARNTELRDAVDAIKTLAEHARVYMPENAKACRCEALDNGEHSVQPLCHWCALREIVNRASRAM